MLASGIRDGHSPDFVTHQKRSLQNGLGSVGCWCLEFGAGAARLRRTSLTLPVAGATEARVAAALLAAAAAPLRSLRSPSSRLRRSRQPELEMKTLRRTRNETLRGRNEHCRDLHQHSLNTSRECCNLSFFHLKRRFNQNSTLRCSFL